MFRAYLRSPALALFPTVSMRSITIAEACARGEFTNMGVIGDATERNDSAGWVPRRERLFFVEHTR